MKASEIQSDESTALFESAETPESPAKEEITFLEFLRNFGPNILASATFFFLVIIQNHYVGKQSSDLLDGVGLSIIYGFSFCYCFGLSIADSIGIISAKYYGAKNFSQMGQTRNLVSIFVFITWLLYFVLTFTLGRTIIRSWTTQSETVVDIAISHAKYGTIYVFLELEFQVLKNYFESHLYYLPTVISTFVEIILYPALGYVFIERFKLMQFGVALAFIVDTLIKVIIMCIFLFRINPYPESNIMFNKNTFNLEHVWKTFKICMSNMLIESGEMIGYLALNIFASRLIASQFSIYLINSSFRNFSFGISFGLANTLILLIGTFVGSNSPHLITKTIHLGLLVAALFYMPLIVLFFIFRNNIVKFFTSDPIIFESKELSMFLLLAGVIMLFEFQVVFMNGIFKGIGKIVIPCVVVSLLVLSLYDPILSYILCFLYQLQLSGIYTAAIVSLIIALAIYVYYYFCLVDLNEICKTYAEQNLMALRKEEKLEESSFSSEI